MKLKVEWTGNKNTYTRCMGNWVIVYNNTKLNIPKNKINEPMNTYKEYERWEFDKNKQVVWKKYKIGLKKKEWIKENKDWIEKMFNEQNYMIYTELLEELFEKINKEDFQPCSCGGCI